MKFKGLFFLLFLFFVSTISANIVIPSIITLSGVFSIFGWSLIVLDLCLIFASIYFLAKHRSLLYKFFAVLVMNLGSILLGAAALAVFEFIIFGVVQLILPTRITDKFIPFFTLNTPINIAYGLFALIAVVLINTGIQMSLGIAFFPTIDRKKLFGCLIAINLLSTSIGLLGIAWYVTKYGAFPGM